MAATRSRWTPVRRDAIALGVAEDVPIYVAEEVLAQTQTDDLEADRGRRRLR